MGEEEEKLTLEKIKMEEEKIYSEIVKLDEDFMEEDIEIEKREENNKTYVKIKKENGAIYTFQEN